MTTTRTLSPADAEDLTLLYEEYDWWEDRQVEDVRRALSETEVAVGIQEDGTLIAAARVLTDYTYYAYVFDVIVACDRRGEGIGKQLMRAVRDHPELDDVTLSLLCRSGLVPFYESVGFFPFDSGMDVPEGGSEDLVIMYEENGEPS